MATSAQYATTPIVEYAQVTAANTNRDGTGTTVLVTSGPTAAQGAGVGKRIARVVVKATGTVTAGMVRFFISTDGGTTKRLLAELPITAVVPSGSVAAFGGPVPELEGVVLQGQVASASCQLYASTHNAETFNIVVYSATY